MTAPVESKMSEHDRAIIAFARRETVRGLVMLVAAVVGLVACIVAMVML